MTNDKYESIINLPHHVSKKHTQLSRASYAAQFSPFAALSGYDGIVAEVARFTDERVELGDKEKDIVLKILELLFCIIEYI